ncbi:MAG: alanine racemase [Clostridia bacterium]|nr:alanine racemase [Clostridia bacterium]
MSEKRAEAVICTENLRKNYNFIKELVYPAKVISVVKAEAYGHGAAEVCRILQSEGCGIFAVATADEGLALRRAGVESDILILGVTPLSQCEILAENAVIQTVNSRGYAEALNAANVYAPIRAHIKIDTGMSRLGLYCHTKKDVKRAADDAEYIHSLPNLHAEGIYTHFACSDEDGDKMTEKQFSAFSALCAECESRGINLGLRHCCNSAAILKYPHMHLDAVRAGILLYGLAPDGKEEKRLEPVMRVIARVSQVTRLKKGDTVSYGAAFTAERDMSIATVSIGYADGIPRLLSGRADVVIRGRRARIIGRICMDMCMVDITNIGDCAPGDEVEIFGGTVSVNELAERMGTINYELLCSVKNRVPRRYI